MDRRFLQQAEDSYKAGDTAKAEALCQQALSRMPGDPDALRLLGVMRLQAGRAADAVPLLRQALEAAPDDLGVLDTLSAALMAVGDATSSEAVLRRALSLDPDLALARLRLGMALASQNKWDEAARAFEAARAGDPQRAEAHYLLGDAMAKLNRNAEAIASFRHAVALDPANPHIHNALGHALQELGLHAAAVACYEQALRLDPSFAVARHNLGMARLQRHEFDRGWPIYEQRLQCPPARAELRKAVATVDLYESLARWQGPGETGVQTLGIWAEQGIGDQVLYSTLIPELVATGLAVTYEVDRRLLEAYARAFPGIRFVPIGDPPQEPLRRADRVLLAGSLPALFRPTRASFTRQSGRTLGAAPERVASYRARLQESPTRLNVALSWRSTRKGGPVLMKSALLAELGPLLEVPGVRFVDVQYGDTRAEREAAERATGVRLHHFDEVDYFNDLEDVLAILEACDLVITTSSATAHLAGALGKRTWILYPAGNPPFYYWAPGDDGRSLWYPSVEIVSSTHLVDWRSLAGEASARLRRETGAGGTRPGRTAPAPADALSAGDELPRAAALRQQGRLDEAVALIRRRLAREPRDARALSELAHAFRWQGNLQEASGAATQATEIAPDLAVAWFNLGAVRVESGEVAAGIEAYRRAVELQPAYAEAWSNLGGALAMTGDAPGEIDAYFRAVGANPGLAPVWSNLGNALLEAGEPQMALDACRRAVALDPGDAAAWNNLGNALRETGQYDEAASAGERAVELSPHSAEAWSNLGCALMEQGDIGKSLEAHRRALALQPENARAQYNQGLALERGRQYRAALDGYRRAIELEPDFPVARLRRACTLLMCGDFAEGWTEYEWRWREKGAHPRRYTFAPWAGERAPGRRLLVWGEQGLGDELIYASMIGKLANAGLRITLETDPRLVGLMQRSFPGVSVVARTDPPGIDPAAFDWQCPLGSLGRWLRPSFAAFPVHRGYLRADAERAGRYAAALRRAGPGRIIGLSWLSANREFGAAKSSRLADWEGLLRVPGCRFADLQYGDTARDRESVRQRLGIPITHLDEVDLFNDIEGLAALVSACDLVITVSNVTAHMAGALGKPVWLLAPAANGRIWYWFHGREDSPWYPSMRIFTQRMGGDWREVLDRARQALADGARGAVDA